MGTFQVVKQAAMAIKFFFSPFVFLQQDFNLMRSIFMENIDLSK